jgi:hypothetical protein
MGREQKIKNKARDKVEIKWRQFQECYMEPELKYSKWKP